MNNPIDGGGLLWYICLESGDGGSYFNKYLIGEDGCVCVCVFSGGALVIYVWGYKCLHIYEDRLKGVLNEGEDHFLTPARLGGIFFSSSFSLSHLLSSSLPLFHASCNLLL